MFTVTCLNRRAGSSIYFLCEHIGCDLPPSNFALAARALGAEAHTIRSSEDLINLDITAMCTDKCPTYVNSLLGFGSSGLG